MNKTISILCMIISIIAIILISASYFMWVYKEAGFEVSIKCFLIWGFCLVSYLVTLLILKQAVE